MYHNREINVINSKENIPTMRVNNVFIHSKYYPSKEAKKYIDNNEIIYENRKNIVVYGLGLGYHIKELLNRVSNNCKIYVFDIDEEIIKIAHELGVVNELKKDSRVKLFLNYSPEILKEFSNKLKLVEDILVYMPSLKVLPNEYADFKKLINSFLMAKGSIERYGNIAQENYRVNREICSNFLSNFYNKNNFKGEPVIIAAAGPSLDQNIDILKTVKGKVRIFAVGSSLRMLVHNDIIPDAVIIIDPVEKVAKQFLGCENLNIPLCFLNTASRWVTSKYKGPKYMFFNEQNSDGYIINTGNTVALAAIDIAVKGGANQIILVGQDLAYVNDKTHAGNYEEMYGESNNLSKSDRYKRVKGIDGSMLKTNSALLHFKENIEKEIEMYRGVNFINCSSGAKIQGTLEMKLEDVIKSY